MRSLTYLVNIIFWLVPTIFCLVIFFPLALIPVIGMSTSCSRLNRVYKREDDERRHKEMMEAIAAGNFNINQGA